MKSSSRRPGRSLVRSTYQVCDWTSEGLIYFMAVFGPWAFGTTETWSVWVMNATAYFLGLLWGVKWFLRRKSGHFASTPPTADSPRPLDQKIVRAMTTGLGVVTVLFLAFVLVSGINARATYLGGDFRLPIYFDYVSWLPHSYAKERTMFLWWTYLGLAVVFWAVRDWLIYQPARHHAGAVAGSRAGNFLLSRRLRRLLWVVSINGGLLGVEGIFQRLDQTNKLLWLVEPHINRTPEAQFGPYAYRSNAAQYFNLLWPVCLGFWYVLQRSIPFRRQRGKIQGEGFHHILLFFGMIMAICPIISLSRMAAVIAIGALLAAGGLFLLTQWRQHWAARAAWVIFFLCILGTGLLLGWGKLSRRFEEKELQTGWAIRERMYEVGRKIAKDYPLFGTGAGTLDPLFQFYRASADEYWPAQLHNDWLETRITFGWLGSALLGLAFLLVIFRSFLPNRIHAPPHFIILIWLAMATCLIHARFDFPFQIYSILFLFVLLCSILFCLSRAPIPNVE